MKKILSIFATVSLLAVLLLPALSLAQPETLANSCTMKNDVKVTDCPASGKVCSEDANCGPDGRWGVCCMLNTIYTVTNWIFYIMTLLAVLMIIYGGFVYLTGAGDPAKATKGKGILTFAVIGLAIALVAKLIPSLVRFILGV